MSEWREVTLGAICEIVRGGSPRPIIEYVTQDSDGINWIKIGDAKAGKWINSTKEKIIRSGLPRSRFVTKGALLLTNSMTIGKPYILNIDGAIHDGWISISNYEQNADRDFLYYFLSSDETYNRFCYLANGSTVTEIDLPPKGGGFFVG